MPSSDTMPVCLLFIRCAARSHPQVAQYMRPKCHALLLDCDLNSPTTVRLNVYQAFLLTAMKLHWCVRLLPSRGAHGDTRLCLSAIQSAISYMVTLVRARSRMATTRLGITCR